MLIRIVMSHYHTAVRSTPTGRRVYTGALLLCVVILLLFPFDYEERGRLVRAVSDAAHAPLMFLVTLALCRLYGRRAVKITIPLLLLAMVAIELLQPLAGRSLSFADTLYGLAGIAGGLLVLLRGTMGCQLIPIGLGCVLVVAVVCYPVRVALDKWRMQQQFPLLCGFETEQEMTRWTASGCSWRRVVRDTGGGCGEAVVDEDPQTDWPGVFMTDLPSDWQEANALSFDLFVGPENQGGFELRVDDQPENPPYAQRFQVTLDLKPGWNHVTIPAEFMRETPSGRLLDLSRIHTFGIFMTRAEPYAYFRLDHVKLELR
jgi:hypothetical protein